MHTYCLAVCEDEQVIREETSRLCGEILENAQIPYEITPFSDAEELGRFLEERGEIFDVLILDIELGSKSGMEFAKELRRKKDRVSIIFLTGYEKYLREGYSVQPVHFLLKPVKKGELEEALLTDWELNHRSRAVLLQKGSRSLNLPLASVFWAETGGNHNVRIVLENGEAEFPILLSELEILLPAEQFVRCHNSYLVSLAHVREFKKSTLYLDNGRELPVGRKYYKRFQEAFISYITQ